MMDNETKIEQLKEDIEFYEILGRYNYYGQKRIEEIKEEIEQYLKEVKKGQLSND